jgi:hypothetical protein
MGVVIEICVRHPGGRTKRGGADVRYACVTPQHNAAF